MKSPYGRFTLLALTACLIGQTTWAETVVDSRQANQAQRIANGTSTGQLTLAEQDRLNSQQTRVATGEARAASDGVMTQREKLKLNARQRNASRHIAHARHDRQILPQ